MMLSDWKGVIEIAQIALTAILTMAVFWLRATFASRQDVADLTARIALVEQRVDAAPSTEAMHKLHLDLVRVCEQITALNDALKRTEHLVSLHHQARLDP